MEDHETAVGLLGVAVELDRPLQGADRSVAVAGVVVELGEAQVGIEGPAVQVLADRLDPGILRSVEQVAPVGIYGTAQRLAGGLVVA